MILEIMNPDNLKTLAIATVTDSKSIKNLYKLEQKLVGPYISEKGFCKEDRKNYLLNSENLNQIKYIHFKKIKPPNDVHIMRINIGIRYETGQKMQKPYQMCTMNLKHAPENNEELEKKREDFRKIVETNETEGVSDDGNPVKVDIPKYRLFGIEYKFNKKNNKILFDKKGLTDPAIYLPVYTSPS